MTGETMLDVKEDGPDVTSVVRSCICNELVVINMVSLTYVAGTVIWLLSCGSRSTAWMRLSVLNFRLFNFMAVAGLVTRKAQKVLVGWWKWDLRQALVFYPQHVRGWRRWMDCPKIAPIVWKKDTDRGYGYGEVCLLELQCRLELLFYCFSICVIII